MSELSKLVGKGKKIKLGDIEIEIKPLTVTALPVLMEMSDKEDKKKQAEAMKETIRLTLMDSVPDATEEEIEKIPLEYMTTLLEAIADINKLGDIDDQKKIFLERIKNEQRPGTTGN